MSTSNPSSIPRSPSRMPPGRVRALSRAISIALSIGLWTNLAGYIAVSIVALFFFGDPDSVLGRAWAEISNAPPDTIGFGRRLLMVMIGVLNCGPLALVLLNLQKLFALFSRGLVFTEAVVHRLHAAGLWLVIFAIGSNIAQGLFLTLADLRDPDMDITILPILYGGMIYVVGHVMAEARRVAEENSSFV